jgi:hypothetical protein
MLNDTKSGTNGKKECVNMLREKKWLRACMKRSGWST